MPILPKCTITLGGRRTFLHGKTRADASGFKEAFIDMTFMGVELAPPGVRDVPHIEPPEHPDVRLVFTDVEALETLRAGIDALLLHGRKVVEWRRVLAAANKRRTKDDD